MSFIKNMFGSKKQQEDRPMVECETQPIVELNPLPTNLYNNCLQWNIGDEVVYIPNNITILKGKITRFELIQCIGDDEVRVYFQLYKDKKEIFVRVYKSLLYQTNRNFLRCLLCNVRLVKNDPKVVKSYLHCLRTDCTDKIAELEDEVHKYDMFEKLEKNPTIENFITYYIQQQRKMLESKGYSAENKKKHKEEIADLYCKVNRINQFAKNNNVDLDGE